MSQFDDIQYYSAREHARYTADMKAAGICTECQGHGQVPGEGDEDQSIECVGCGGSGFEVLL